MGEVMTRIAYLYQGNKEYIDKLLDYDLTIIIDDEKYVNDLKEYNVTIRNFKYNSECFDISISETDKVLIPATKKVVIGEFQTHKSKVHYLDKFNLQKVLEKPQKKDVKFSIIVPNYNNGEWINKTIESVINQTYQNWELYIIDDMSTDNSVKTIKEYKDKRITLIENEIKLYNGGSRNIGILRAKKSNIDGYLLFIDSDDWLANDRVLENLNAFIDDEDLITLDYQYYKDDKIQEAKKQCSKNKDELFMAIGSMVAVWCKCFKVRIAPLFEFNTLMEDRNYHYRLINRVETFSNFGMVTHTWNRMNWKSVTSLIDQKYGNSLQAPIEWSNCAYRHIAGMLDLINELDNPVYIAFIKKRINECKSLIQSGMYHQH